MQKFFLSLGFIFFLSSSSFTQDTMAVQSVPLYAEDLISAAINKHFPAILFYKDPTKAKLLILDKTGKVRHIIKRLETFPKSMALAGVLQDEDRLQLIYIHSKKPRISILEIDRETGAQTEKSLELPDFEKNTRPVTFFTFDNENIYFLFQQPKAGNLIVTKANLDGILYTRHFSAPVKNFYKMLRVDTEDNLSDPGLTYMPVATPVNQENQNGLYVAYRKSKVYLINDDYLRMTLDAYNTTFVLDIDLQNEAISVDSVGYPDFLKESKGDHNSFYHNGRIFKFCNNQNQFEVLGLSWPEKDTILRYRVSESEDITPRNSAVIQQGSDWSKKVEKDIEDTGKFLHKLWQADAAISVYEEAGKYVLTVGGFNDSPGKGWQTAALMSVTYGYTPGPTLGAPFFYSETYFYGPLFHFNPAAWQYFHERAMYSLDRSANAPDFKTKSVFYSILLDHSYQATEGEIPSGKYQILEDYFNKNDDQTKARLITAWQDENDLWFLYYNAVFREVVVMKKDGFYADEN